MAGRLRVGNTRGPSAETEMFKGSCSQWVYLVVLKTTPVNGPASPPPSGAPAT